MEKKIKDAKKKAEAKIEEAKKDAKNSIKAG